MWITFIGGSEDKESLQQLVEGAEVLIHLAHFPGPAKTEDEYVTVNVNGSYDLLQAAKIAKVKQVVFMSACAIFGTIQPSVGESSPLDESHPVQTQFTLWSDKIINRIILFLSCAKSGFDITILRPRDDLWRTSRSSKI